MTLSCTRHEGEALLAIKNTIDCQSSWIGEDCCTWRGVQCDRTGDVVELTIPSSWNDHGRYTGSCKLEGRIHPGITRSNQLRAIDFSDDSLFGSIPESLGDVTTAEHAHSGCNKLNKSIPTSIRRLMGKVGETHLSSLHRLKRLDLLANPGIKLEIRPSWASPFQLEEIYFYGCNIGLAFPKWLHTQKSMSVLSLSGAGISGSTPGWFCKISSNLAILELPKNLLGNWTFNIIARTIPPLQTWEARNCGLSGKIPGSLCEMKELRILSLSGDELSGLQKSCNSVGIEGTSEENLLIIVNKIEGES